MFGLFKRRPEPTSVYVRTYDKTPEPTIVYVRTYDKTPARFGEVEVHYDAWGTPFVYWDPWHTSGGFTNELRPNGEACRLMQWKHKSGPAVTFPNKKAPDYGWFPEARPC